jgi:excisionase family DNA binding protein
MSETEVAESPQLLTPDDVAEWLNVKKSWVYAAAAAGTLPAVKVGRWVRFDRDVVRRWIDAGGAES